MPKVTVFDMAGKNVGEMELSDSVFAIKPNTAAMHAMVISYLANRRQGTQSTLTRAEVRGGGRKPWRQKGTGHARQGSTRAPHWRHGGVALGPKPRSYRFSLNKKYRRLAIKSAFSSKVAGGEFIIVDNITTDEFKTKNMIAMLTALNAEGKALIVTPAADIKVIKSAANIPGVKTSGVNALSVYDILNCGKLVIAKEAVQKLEEVYAQ
ncbi:MAG: 50S ribosomal protein L4 [Oscillospiraceae bacterium]|nr:50S ribosomal protein L4 [Oscillospiraceae bacterium]